MNAEQINSRNQLFRGTTHIVQDGTLVELQRNAPCISVSALPIVHYRCYMSRHIIIILSSLF